jgi:flagellar secretion chaperone FliS
MEANHYLVNEIQTASSQKLVLMLYDGASKFLARIIALDDMKNDLELVNYNINKAFSIVSELQRNLDMTVGDVSANLFSLYDYMGQQLTVANIKKEIEPVKVVAKMLSELRDTWAEMMVIASKEAHGVTEPRLEETMASEQASVDAPVYAGGFELAG